MLNKIIILSCSLLCFQSVVGQSYLKNPSFEDEAQDATTPQGWMPCEEGTTPDILPGYWGVYNQANDGDTYVGLITRENGTFESIGQRLEIGLTKGECYKFSLALAHSRFYSGYNRSLKLRIWLGKKKCGKDQLIYESVTIQHSQWKAYKVEFTCDSEYEYILFEAYHEGPTPNHEANILLDDISTIFSCSRA